MEPLKTCERGEAITWPYKKSNNVVVDAVQVSLNARAELRLFLIAIIN